jgi:hypothetical protein
MTGITELPITLSLTRHAPLLIPDLDLSSLKVVLPQPITQVGGAPGGQAVHVAVLLAPGCV